MYFSIELGCRTHHPRQQAINTVHVALWSGSGLSDRSPLSNIQYRKYCRLVSPRFFADDRLEPTAVLNLPAPIYINEHQRTYRRTSPNAYNVHQRQHPFVRVSSFSDSNTVFRSVLWTCADLRGWDSPSSGKCSCPCGKTLQHS